MGVRNGCGELVRRRPAPEYVSDSPSAMRFTCARGEHRIDTSMSDTPSGPDATVVCPACESERIERLGDSAGDLDYRCLDCGAEFDEDGGREIIA